MNIDFTLCLLLFLTLGAAAAGQACPCPKILKWVCGGDGKSYQNDCLAACAGVDVEYEGQCVPADKRALPKCNGSTVKCLVSPCSVSKSACKDRSDLVCLDNYCAKDTTLDGVTIKGGCTAVYLTKAAGLVARGCLEGKGCVCPAIFSPVCGTNGETYGNSCEAACTRVPVAYKGRCKPDCTTIRCGNDVLPVCAVNGKSYKNACQAQCVYDQAILFDGPCPPAELPASCAAITCSTDGPQVCGVDGKNYPNECVAACAGIQTAYVGECSPDPPACRCTREFAPVCGVDGKTYSNKCLAGCAGVKVASTGACVSTPVPPACPCPRNFAPVCGKDGKTYDNSCLAACAKVEVASDGPCVSDCAAVLCPSTGPQVCGADGKTYPNECLAKCSGTTVASTGACKKLCKCPAGPKVCGKDGKTYLNACAASCADVGVAYTGPCTKPKSSTIRCAKSDPGARCVANPCSQPNSCKANPRATCLTFYCTKPVTFQGVKLTKACSAVYVTKAAGVLIPGCK